MQELVVETHRKEELVDITSLVDRAVRRLSVSEGTCFVHSSHTTAGITINESADPTVAADLLDALARVIPEDVPWRHREGNAPAHIKTSLVGSSASVPIEAGRLVLGTWQGIFLCEFDGPRSRRVLVRVSS